jgi:hypothetical protein
MKLPAHAKTEGSLDTAARSMVVERARRQGAAGIPVLVE